MLRNPIRRALHRFSSQLESLRRRQTLCGRFKRDAGTASGMAGFEQPLKEDPNFTGSRDALMVSNSKYGNYA
jgi:hypothetical protein